MNFKIVYQDNYPKKAIWLVTFGQPFDFSEVKEELQRLCVARFVKKSRFKEILGFCKPEDKRISYIFLGEFSKGYKMPRKTYAKITPETTGDVYYNGDIEVLANISGKCKVEAVGDIFAPMGEINKGAHVISGGNLIAGRIEGARITCYGDLCVIQRIDEGSKIYCGKNVDVGHGIYKAEIIGDTHVTAESAHDSLIVAACMVSIKNAGNHMGVSTTIIAGCPPVIVEELRQKQERGLKLISHIKPRLCHI